MEDFLEIYTKVCVVFSQSEFLANFAAVYVVPFFPDIASDVFPLKADHVQAAIFYFRFRKSLVFQKTDEPWICRSESHPGSVHEVFSVVNES